MWKRKKNYILIYIKIENENRVKGNHICHYYLIGCVLIHTANFSQFHEMRKIMDDIFQVKQKKKTNFINIFPM